MTEQQQGDEPWSEQAQVGDIERLTAALKQVGKELAEAKAENDSGWTDGEYQYLKDERDRAEQLLSEARATIEAGKAYADEEAQVGDTVRLTITTKGVVRTDQSGRMGVDGWYLDGPDATVEILSRATPPLPNEPGTWWLDKDDDVWRVNFAGNLYPVANSGQPWVVIHHAPFRQLVLK